MRPGLVFLVLGVAACAALGSSGGAPFADVARVLRHPRCLNCHTVTEFPRVGDDRRRHAMNVLRGPHDHGVSAMQCATCHRSQNQPLAGVPGAPHWALAPLSMGWEGLDDHDLAKALVDPAKNGGRSLESLVEHMRDDALVGWAWDPGPGREPPPLSRDAFVRAFQEWIDGGAVPPPPGTTSSF